MHSVDMTVLKLFSPFSMLHTFNKDHKSDGVSVTAYMDTTSFWNTESPLILKQLKINVLWQKWDYLKCNRWLHRPDGSQYEPQSSKACMHYMSYTKKCSTGGKWNSVTLYHVNFTYDDHFVLCVTGFHFKVYIPPRICPSSTFNVFTDINDT